MSKRRPFVGDRLLTVGEVAATMRVSNMTVYRLIKSGQLAAIRVGKNYRLRESDVDRCLSERSGEGGTMGKRSQSGWVGRQAGDRLLTVAEVAATMRVSNMTVYRLIKNGELPALRGGKNSRSREWGGEA